MWDARLITQRIHFMPYPSLRRRTLNISPLTALFLALLFREKRLVDFSHHVRFRLDELLHLLAGQVARLGPLALEQLDEGVILGHFLDDLPDPGNDRRRGLSCR